jgi:hypothetical protein
MADENARELCEREHKAFEAKDNLHSLWQELALAFYPERADFTGEICLGAEFASDLFDSEPLRCRRDLADARSAMLRPEGQEWVKAETPDKKLNERPDIAKALDYINDRARTFLNDADKGFIGAEKEADHDIATFGGAVKTAESDIDRNGNRVPVIRCWHLRDCAWFDDMTGVRQDVMFRRFKASARHIRKKFPDAALHESITLALEKDPDKQFNFCHVMMPADEYDYHKKPPRGGRKMPWASVYYDSEHKTLLRERPSERFRYVVDRWARIPGSQYPYSPSAMVSLPDARGIQTMAMVLLEAGEKSVDPPMLARDGAFKSDIEFGAAGVTWYDSTRYDERTGPLIQPLIPEMRNIPLGIDMMMRTTQALRDNWYLSKLRLPQQAKTAFETQALLEEFIRANIPLFGPWQAGLSMMLEEIFGVLFDMRWFDMNGWPEELSGSDLSFSYSNPLHDAIERNRVNQAQQVLGILAGAMQIDQAAGKSIDVVKMVQDATRGTGAPSDWITDEDATQQAVADSSQASSIVNALGVAQQAADVAKTGTEAATNLHQINQTAADGSFPTGPT